MPPVARNAMARPPANGQVNGGIRAQEPPPSTLAANLVNNLTNASKPTNNDEQEDFQQLLLELSKNSDGTSGPNTGDGKIEHHHKLIYVVTKAVLGPFLKDNPFSNVEQQLQQASEAVDILIATIRETPEVLNHVAGPQAKLQSGSQVPLWLWLFPHILPLLGLHRCEDIQSKIKELIQICFEVASRSLGLWGLTTYFFCYFKHCVDGILEHLQESSSITNGRHSQLGLILPPATIENEITLHGGPDLHLEGCTYALNDANIALTHCSLLLSCLVDMTMISSRSYDATPALQGYLIWIADSMALTVQIEKSMMAPDAAHSQKSTALYLNLVSCQKLLDSREKILSTTSTRKLFRLLLNFTVEYGTKYADMHNLDTQQCLLLVLPTIAEIGKADSAFGDLLNLELLPFLKEWTVMLNNIEEHGTDLLACIEDIVSISQNSEAMAQHVAIVPIDGLLIGVDDDDLETKPSSRPAKRRKTARAPVVVEGIISELWMLLGGESLPDLNGLKLRSGSHFTELDESARCRAFVLLQNLACACAGTLIVKDEGASASNIVVCNVCDGSPDLGFILDLDGKDMALEAIQIFESIVGSAEFEQSRRSRIQAMITLRSFVTHFRFTEFLSLETSALGHWCLKSLRSSMRELRIVAGRTLPKFLSGEAASDVLESNRQNVLAILRELSDNSPPQLKETCVLAWGQIGRVANDHDLNLILTRLVDYLGNSNQVVSSVAFNEIILLSDARGVPVGQMFSPFWKTIAPVVVRDLQSRPQTAQLMADTLSISVADFLVLTQAHTLPWLILSKKRDIIVKIAQARGDEGPQDPWDPFFEHSNAATVMACLLVQPVPDLDNFIMTLMRHVSPHFNELDLSDLLKVEPIGIAVELLKNAGQEDDSRKSRVRYALQLLASRIISNGVDSQNGKRSNLVGPFLEQYILGIMAQFSDLLNDVRGWQSVSEKIRSLRGLEELLRVGRSYIRSALPQICSCLQSALSRDDIRSSAFSSWATMVRSLDDEDVGVILENTYAIIITYWEDFDALSQQIAKDLVGYLTSKRRDLLQDFIHVLPSVAHIPELEKYEKDVSGLRKELDVRQKFETFERRIEHEHGSVVAQALVELSSYLQTHQGFLQTSAISEQPDPVVGKLVRSVLDACVKFNGSHSNISRLCAECIGLIGCLDSNRVESVRERREYVAISNFKDADDTTDFTLFLLEEVLVKAFLSATTPKAQGFLSYAMQELLEKCDFKEVVSIHRHPGDHSKTAAIYAKWMALPETVQVTLAPFLKSRYVITEMLKSQVEYPIYQPEKKYIVWLRSFVLDLLEKPHNNFAMLIFAPLCRTIRIEDSSVASFLLPYVVLHTVVAGSPLQRENIKQEIIRVLSQQISPENHREFTNVKLCSEAIFRVLDYMSRWIQDRQAQTSRKRGHDSRYAQTDDTRSLLDPDIEQVNELLSSIPPEMISSRAVDCKSYSRALFHWEQHIRQTRELAAKLTRVEDKAAVKNEDADMLLRLQEIYAQIDEPDGIEGISAHLNLDIDQQILGHRKNGRWAAAQSWYEIKLAEDSTDLDTQVNLLYCLKESGQHDVLLNYVEGMQASGSAASRLVPFAAEASWTTGRWDVLQKHLNFAPVELGGDFNVSVGRALLFLHHKDRTQFEVAIQSLREQVAGSLSTATTSSLGSCHDSMLKFHVLTELEMIAGSQIDESQRQSILESLDRRLEVIGAYLNDKQYILGIRRAAMQLSPEQFYKGDVASAWLTTAKLARKGNAIHQSFNAVLHASQLGDASAKIEHARLLWKGGNSRQAIQSLQSAIDNNAFISHNQAAINPTSFTAESATDQQNLLTARAHLLLAKWLDTAGQTQSAALRSQYQLAVKTHQNWEKGHYYLGRHYYKLLEAEKSLSPDNQSTPYLTGETAKLVVENYLRSLSYGTKYIYQTLPRLLTLWLDLGTQVSTAPDIKAGSKEWAKTLVEKRKEQLKQLNSKIQKYVNKMPAYILYTALAQIVARIVHPNLEVYKLLQATISKVVEAHPQQALWTLFAVSTSTQEPRKLRGTAILHILRNANRKADIGGYDIRTLITKGEKLANELLMCCNSGDFQSNRTITASLTRDLGFTPRACVPNPLVVPVQATLTATLPTLTDKIRTHKAFSRDVVTVDSFSDEVLILSSLQKPRKLTARGSDGKMYGLMCKPKDDLRKDQRLMEFNSMINRSLKRDAESSKRQLYIKTYAVTPLNEECGIIEWVDGLKTLRDILLSLYKAKGITPNYAEIRTYLDEACKGPEKLPFFTQKVLGTFPPVFHTWFVQQFPDPSTWFAARLRYTRSCAVMSMIGTILGLGDRHGENILFEEGNGGTFHVDFNCLFDKGLTFAQPERVPFRLTHNMVDAMGVYGYEGPFRKSCELTLSQLRQHEDTLMTILEAFVYDPTLDFVVKKNKRKPAGGDREGPPDTAQGVLNEIRRKLRGLLAGESVPLGVEGQVDELIKLAVSPKNLASMYIGWCAFF